MRIKIDRMLAKTFTKVTDDRFIDEFLFYEKRERFFKNRKLSGCSKFVYISRSLYPLSQCLELRN